jgi:hypothetical protein
MGGRACWWETPLAEMFLNLEYFEFKSYITCNAWAHSFIYAQFFIMQYCILGCVDIGTSTGEQSGFVYFHEKTRKMAKKVFWSNDLMRKSHSFLCQALEYMYNGQKLFFHNMGLMGKKRRRI